MMKASVLVAALALTLSACASNSTSRNDYDGHQHHKDHAKACAMHQNTDCKHKHHGKKKHRKEHAMVGMANPASVYCQKVGGKSHIKKEANGEVGYCHLPNGQVVEEWALFRAAHPEPR